jgi:hypothetical protein
LRYLLNFQTPSFNSLSKQNEENLWTYYFMPSL